MDRFCKDCKHFRISSSKLPIFARCGKFGQKKPLYMVTGELDYPYCEYARNDEELCGMKGDSWEER